ncbi:hypothetical protein ACFLRP_00590 [Bacteroidota bacterium]
MDKIELEAAHREVLGKKVRHLRHREITPAHLFGHDVASLSLQCQTAELKRALTQAGKTGLINLKLDTAKKPRVAGTLHLIAGRAVIISGHPIHS